MITHLRHKTTGRLHQLCSEKFSWYERWHQHPRHHHVHLLLFVVFFVGMVSGVLFQLYFIPRTFAAAGINKQLNYQGRLMNSSGSAAVTDGTYSMVFSLYSVASGGSASWTETQTATVTNGFFSVMLGSVSSLSSIDFSDDTYFLGVKVGSDAEMTPRKRIGAAAYAFNADTLDALDSSAFLRADQSATSTGGLVFSGVTTDLASATDEDLRLDPGGTGDTVVITAASSNFQITDGTSTVFAVDNTGIVTSATWQGTAIGAAYGGTGADLSGATGAVSVAAGSFSAGTLSVANGGTGAATFTTNGLLYGNGTSALSVTAAGTSGQLVVAGADGIPAFVSMSSDAAISNTGALTISADAIGSAEIAANAVAMADLARGTDGQIIVANTSADSAYVSVSGDAALSAAGSLTIAANSVALATDTTGDFVAAVTTSALTGLTGGNAAAENTTSALAFDYSATLAANPALAVSACVFATTGLICEGSSADAFETLLTVANPGADVTITFPAVTGTVITTGDTATVTSAMIGANVVAMADLVRGTDGQIIVANTSADSAYVSVSGDATLSAAGALTVVDVTCTDCLNATEIEDLYVLNTGDTIAGNLTFNDGTTDSPTATFTPQTGTAWEIFVVDTDDDLTIRPTTDTGTTERVEFDGTGTTTVDVSIPDGTLYVGEITDSDGVVINMNSALNMGNALITNIGATGTDFTSGGGLTLASTLTANSLAQFSGTAGNSTSVGGAARAKANIIDGSDSSINNNDESALLVSYLVNDSNGDSGSLQGISSMPQWNSAGQTIGSLRGFRSLPVNVAGTATNIAGFYADTPSNSGTVTSSYGLYVADQTVGETDYGIYIAGADNYAIYTAADDVWFTLGAADKVYIEAITADSTGTAGVLDIDVDTISSQQGINVDLETITDSTSDTVAGIQINATQTSTDNDVIYGLHVMNLMGIADAGNEYAIYQAGTGWDYGIVAEDDVQFQGNTDINLDAGEAVTIDVAANTAETLDITATAAGNDGVEINFTLVNDVDVDTVAALDINVTSATTGDNDVLYGLNIANLASADGTVSERAIKIGTSWDYGIDIGGAATYALWVSSATDPTAAAGGIIFGASRDTNLYRSAMDTLRTDDTFTVGANLSVTGTANIGSISNTGNNAALCWDNSGASDIEDCNGAPADLAENFGTSDPSIEAGDVVVLTDEAIEYDVLLSNGARSRTSKAWIQKSTVSYTPTLLGVVSTNPNQVYGDDNLFLPAEHPRPVSLAGRVPVKVSTINGFIAPGDRLTSSSLPGVAMKATEPGMVLGVALQSWIGPGEGKVVMFVNPGWWGGDASVVQGGAVSGAALNTEHLAVKELTVTGSASVQGSLTVAGDATFKGRVVVEGDTELRGNVSFNADTAGTVRISKGERFADVMFSRMLSGSPHVVVTPTADPKTSWWVDRVYEQGFRVNLSKPAEQDLDMEWIALLSR